MTIARRQVEAAGRLKRWLRPVLTIALPASTVSGRAPAVQNVTMPSDEAAEDGL